MVAWGSINGNYEPSYKYTMTDVLRKTWGWQGFSMTDWAASTKDFPTAANWGVDMRMPYQYDYTPANFATMPDSIVNMHARRVIRAQKLIGALETGYSRTAYTTYLLSSEHRRIARLIGAKSIVLARNTGNILPLPKTGARIALTGPYATTCRLGGGGSSGVGPAIQINPSQGIRELLASVGAGASTIVTDINQADYIVVFVGISGETEGADRGALGLTDGNSDVAAALVAKPTKTIVVYTGGSASTPGTWSTAPAIVIAFYPGQEQGYCIADVLFGNANPCGKLAVTFPNDATQPADFQYHTTTTNNETLIYSRADTAYGYFRVNKRGVSPLFNFGHGLSYTTFSYSNLSINPGSIVVGDRVLVQVDITNTGARAGEEVVQLYLTMPGDKGVPVRVQDLRGFKKVALQAGETKKLTFTLTFDDMAYFDVGAAEWDGDGRFKVLPGVFTVRVGTSSEITRQPTVSSSFTVQ
jgi:beta-glucosidase